MRLIDADALIPNISVKAVFGNDITTMKCGELRTVLEMIENAPTIEPQRWIPCKERLPEECEDIIVTYVDDEETRIIPVNYGDGTWYDCIFNTALDPIKVIAWMPLPESYKEVQDEIN